MWYFKSIYIHVLLICILTSKHATAQNYSSGAGGSYTTCAGTFYDSGGNTSYGNSQNYTTTFCPSTAGQCMKVAFSSFDLEDNFDYLSVYNGSSTSAPMVMGSSFTAASPGTITATTSNVSRCLTFKFSSDGATTSSGWVANISCATCVAAYPSGVQQDCNGAITICSNQSVAGTSLGSGSYNDLNSGLGNLGCINNYAATPNGSGEHQSNWYFFSPLTSGTIGMTIAPSSATTDYDWAIYGPYASIPCPPTGLPLRCSAATAGNSTAGATGLGNGATDTDEGTSGNGWVAPINVIAGQKYILFLDNWNATSAPYTLSWQLTNGATLGCPLLPIEILSFTGQNKKNYNSIEWITASENNNAYFVLERSTDAVNWKEITKVKGAGNSSHNIFYNYPDYSFVGHEINYYRLKQVDFNNDFKYSSTMTIEASESPQTQISNFHPNPTNEVINFDIISSQSSFAKIQVLDYTGNCLIEDTQPITIGKNDVSINLRNLRNGIYMIKVETNSSDKSLVQKIIKY